MDHRCLALAAIEMRLARTATVVNLTNCLFNQVHSDPFSSHSLALHS